MKYDQRSVTGREVLRVPRAAGEAEDVGQAIGDRGEALGRPDGREQRRGRLFESRQDYGPRCRLLESAKRENVTNSDIISDN